MRFSSALLCAALLAPAPSGAFTIEEMLAEFDARNLTYEERRFLQLALAFEGGYVAMQDGAWGQGSQNALERWVSQNDLDLPVENWEAVMLTVVNLDRIQTEGWRQLYLEPLDMSVAMPAGDRLTKSEGDNSVTYAHTESSLRYTMMIGDLPQVLRLHDNAQAGAATMTTPYTLRRNDLYITSAQQPDGTTLYLRSDLRQRGWSTIAVSVAGQDGNLLSVASGSITRGPAPNFDLPQSGQLVEGMASLAEILATEGGAGGAGDMADLPDGLASPIPPAMAPAPSAAPAPAAPQLAGTGTAFAVSADGKLLTNAHVVQDCAALRVNGQPVVLLASDPAFDLALLAGPPTTSDAVARFATDPAPLNADITVAGYPLTGILSGLNVTRGNVTSLKGLSGDATQMQISAPIQPGNSGGPAVDSAGNVVGVIVSKLDASRTAEVTGDIPQNVNFAVRGEIAKLFLFQNGVTPLQAGTGAEAALDPVVMARQLDKVTRLVECYSQP